MKMLKTIVKQFVHRPSTLMFPAEPGKSFEATRGSIAFEPSKCTSCTLCMKRCPSDSIVVDKTAKTWSIDRFRCIICGSCADLCRFGALSMTPCYSSAKTGEERRESGIDTYAITYVKPEKPKTDPAKKDS